MCGIAGIVRRSTGPIDPTIIGRLMQLLEHRGPDDKGYLTYRPGMLRTGRTLDTTVDADLALIHRRLSILDLSESGWQPMVTPDGRYAVVFNGEIYNFVELREQLCKQGVGFRSTSDTEVLLWAFATWGPRALSRLVGMFAFAILDTSDRKMYLARDFFGIKPLFYAVNVGPFRLAFASEIPALLDIPGVERNVHPQRLYEFLRFGLANHAGDTLLDSIKEIPPGHLMTFCLDTNEIVRPERYWRVSEEVIKDLSFKEAASHLRNLFEDSVRLHLRSDVPVGASLSGGIDSSAVVAVARSMQTENTPLHTFSYIPDDPSLSEESWIDLMSQAFGTTVHKTQPQPADLLADIERLIAAQGQPFHTLSVYAQFRIFRLVAEAGIKVTLDGQGADEMLAGYRHLLGARLTTLVRSREWRAAFSFARSASKEPGVGMAKLGQLFFAYFASPTAQAPFRRLVGRDTMPDWLNGNWFRDRDVMAIAPQYIESRESLKAASRRLVFETGLPNLLHIEDRNSMAFSIESRVPFLTPALVSFVLNLPESYVLSGEGESKSVFRAAMRGIVPDAILNRRDKVGFEGPNERWAASLLPWAEQVLKGEASHSIPCLKLPIIERVIRQARSGDQSCTLQIWGALSLIEWSRQFGITYH